MKKLEMSLYEWFDLMAFSNNDQEIILHLLESLEGYTTRPTTEDLIQLINFIGAVRLHQLRDKSLRPIVGGG